MKKYLKFIPILICFIIIILVSIKIVDLNVLPTKYLYTFLISEFLFLTLSIFLIISKKKILWIIGLVLSILSIIGNSILFYYLDHTNNYMVNNFLISSYKVKTPYYVVAGINNPIEGLEELENNHEVYYYKYSNAVQDALKKLGNYNYIDTTDGFQILKRVRDENQLLVVAKLDYEFVIEANDELKHEEFKVINEFDVSQEIKKNMETPSSYNIYISGMDYSRSRRDYNAIVTVNTKTHKVVITSIPRDYYIDIPAFGVKDSLSNMGSADPNNTKEALEKLFNIKIDYTVNLYTESLIQVVDTIGGVEFCSDKSYYTTHDTTFGSYNDWGEKVYVKEGCHTYNGIEILTIARERVKVPGDRARIANDRQILINIGKKLANMTSLTNYSDILNSFDGAYTTNINKTTITNLIKEALDNPNFEIIEQSVDGEDQIREARFGGDLWALEPYMDTVNNASNKINEVINEK